ncbi:MAG: hypothetical protein LBR27_00875 [Bifidobacteriaceae bacterium]|jgi:hypothetical protein|nr:hypothetical protein [Bifidobacteriaceae bacterium]
MGSLLDQLDQPAAWADFLDYKRTKGHLTKRQDQALAAFVEGQGYLAPVAALRSGCFPLPQRRLVNKAGSTKKRVVYSFPDDATYVLKLLAHLLYRYDSRQPPGCYSFRRGISAHSAIRALAGTNGIGQMWCYKADVADYFNSIDVGRLLPMLAAVVDDDPDLLDCLSGLLTADAAWQDGSLVIGPRGVMAGVPLAPFLANLYLGDLDRELAGRAPYARYSDDIIVFAQSLAQAEAFRGLIHRRLAELGLRVNPVKESLTGPGEAWEFLGVAYQDGQIDLSLATRKKLKGKIRRKARALRRWMLRHEASPQRAVGATIRVFNRKFFVGRGRDELNWSRWFFPLLTRPDSLHEMDVYLQQYLRWIPTGRHRAGNYRLSYADLKDLGYRSLVHEYHAYRARVAGSQGDRAASGVDRRHPM